MSTETNYNCSFEGCTKSFKARKSLVEHMRIHKGEKPYQCHFPGCEKRFTQYSSMQKHERTHTGDKPYRCNICDRDFTQISNLKRHERVHAGEKPHECEYCQKKFSTASNLKQHLHIHEKGDIREKYFCNVCKKMYLYRSSLRKHLQEHEDGVLFSVQGDSVGDCNEDFFDMKLETDIFRSEETNNTKEENQNYDHRYMQHSMNAPEPSKYIFVDDEHRIKPLVADFRGADFPEYLQEAPKFFENQISFTKFSNFDLFPASPSNYLFKPAEPDSDSKILPLTPLLGSPLRDKPSTFNHNSTWDFPFMPNRSKISNSVVYYQGEMYYLYDRTLNKYKPNGELVIRQIENDETNPTRYHPLSEVSHYPTYESLHKAYKEVAHQYRECLTLEMLMSGKNCNSLICNCGTGHGGCDKCACGQGNNEGHDHGHEGHEHSHEHGHEHLHEEPSNNGLYEQADFFEQKNEFFDFKKNEDECPLDDNFCAKMREQKAKSKDDHVCLCEVTRGFRHVHGPNCGHPAIMHDNHVDYIVDGILHHFNGENCDNHGPICLVEKASEEYAMGLISSGALPECKV